ncbi:hypothetical protein [Pseudoruegeria sp. HB172150]|uniref:hypothetical protein n=1 Tax=Pseudoruegeria sp. HB172150 TaxID=2721164 RepID=UPI001557214A|nr:hypothetical protein [Pseudoruegeria sp. HB172150]
MKNDLLKTARQNRLSALGALATQKEDNLFQIEDARQRRNVAAESVMFSSCRKPVNTEERLPQLLLVA